MLKKILITPVLAFGLLLSATPVSLAQSTHSQELSTISLLLPVAVAASAVVGTGRALAEGSKLTVSAVKTTAGIAGQSVEVTLKTLSDAGEPLFRFTTDSIATASALTGQVLTAVIVETGTVLEAAGKAIAFIPKNGSEVVLSHERLL
jgi:hypothetical protein